MKYNSKFFMDIHGCILEYTVLAKHVLTLIHNKHALVEAVLGYNLSLLNSDTIDEVYKKILFIIKTSNEEVETINTVTKCKVKNIQHEIKNELARYTDGLCTLYMHATDEHGLLNNVEWQNLAYWDFLILAVLQKQLVEEYNKKIKKIK